jgi:hypothetical protein
MNKALVIRQSDNWNTRRSKKTFRAKLKRRKKTYRNPFRHYTGSSNENQYEKSTITYTNYIEHFCQVNNLNQWKRSNSTIRLNSQFSLFENPAFVLRTLLQMLHRAKTSQQLTRLKYEGQVSFGALYLLDNFCWEIAKRRKWQIMCENISESEKEKLSRLRSIISSTYESDTAYMINERVRINRSGDPKAEQSYKVKAKEITDLVQKTIRQTSSNQDYNLSFGAYQAINSAIGEHFDNIILHAPDADFGVLCGFYDKEIKEISILIYNFGNTIYDTLTTDSLPEPIKEEMIEIIKNHAAKNFFLGKSKFNKENAITLLAIQEGISSRVKYDKTRGHGLMDFIEHCFNLNENTRVTLISGNTAIKIDKKYRFERKMLFGRERRVLALNESNNIFDKPDESYVLNLDVCFPGVLVETIIPLN